MSRCTVRRNTLPSQTVTMQLSLWYRRLLHLLLARIKPKGEPHLVNEQVKIERQRKQNNFSLIIAFLTCITAMSAAYAVWQTSEIARLRYYDTIRRIKFDFKLTPKGTAEGVASSILEVCQISGEFYNLESITIVPRFRALDEITSGKSFSKTVELTRTPDRTDCDYYDELIELKQEICGDKSCSDRTISSLKLEYKVHDQDRRRVIIWE